MSEPFDPYGDPAEMSDEERDRAARQRDAAIEALEDPAWGDVGEAADAFVADLDDSLGAA